MIRHRSLWLIAVTVELLVWIAPITHSSVLAANCDKAYLPGLVPLTDLVGDYQGETGGLYPDGTNVAPSAHETLGLQMAAEIEPLGSNGQPASTGRIGFISIGVSNTAAEFEAFLSRDISLADPAVVAVNGAQSGAPITDWLAASAPAWGIVNDRLTSAGLSPLQVQVAWVKLPESGPTEPFPIDATTYADDLAQVLRNLKSNYPNLKIAYLSSRIYGGYGGFPSPEPWAYQHGFGVKWTIQAQIEGDPTLNPDPSRGAVAAPWIAWGPYLWANGAGPDLQAGGTPGRADGLEWLCEDFTTDGIHPVESGSAKVADLLITHLTSDATACLWYLIDQSQCGSTPIPVPVPVPIPTVTFTDIAGSEFAADIMWLAEQGITNGCSPPPNALFCPNGLVTRGQMAAFLTRALSLPSGPDAFTDDETSIFEADINALAQAGITRGCNPPANTSFCPDDSVTRGQMSAFLTRALSLPSGPDAFTDDETSIFEADINALAQAGITLGCDPPANTAFCPGGLVTRGQMAAFLHRAEEFLPS